MSSVPVTKIKFRSKCINYFSIFTTHYIFEKNCLHLDCKKYICKLTNIVE